MIHFFHGMRLECVQENIFLLQVQSVQLCCHLLPPENKKNPLKTRPPSPLAAALCQWHPALSLKCFLASLGS